MPGVMGAFWQLLSSAIKSDGIEDNTDPLDFDAIARSLIDSAADDDAQSDEPEIDESAYLDYISPLLAPGLPNLSSSSTIPSTAVPPSQMVVWPPVRVSTGREGYGVDGQRRNARNAPGHVPGIAIDGSLTLLTPSQWVNIDSWSDWSDPGSMHTLSRPTITNRRDVYSCWVKFGEACVLTCAIMIDATREIYVNKDTIAVVVRFRRVAQLDRHRLISASGMDADALLEILSTIRVVSVRE
ncbi:hypothetical protein HWV62_21136 [Athelia sp. TMB]|nr:hypothetical protein HWV62_21136 [Athelia sp. TMB]